jgi:hypothetical protein
MRRLLNEKLIAFPIFLLLATVAFGQQPGPSPVNPTDAAGVEKTQKSKVFEITYRNPVSLMRVLQNLGSGIGLATMSADSDFRTITVRDFPENLVTIEQAIKRLDTPTKPQPNIEVHMHVLLASNAAVSADAAQMPADLKDVLTQLKQTLTYRNYGMVTSIVQRLTETNRGLRGKGTAELSGLQPSGGMLVAPYDYFINMVSVTRGDTGTASIQINEFGFTLNSGGDVSQVQTALNLRDGEKVVVGTATIRDRALIVVISAKVIQ